MKALNFFHCSCMCFLIPSTMYVCMYVGRCQIDCIQCEIVYNSQEMIFDVISISKFIIGHFWRTQTLHQSLSVGVDVCFLFTFFQQTNAGKNEFMSKITQWRKSTSGCPAKPTHSSQYFSCQILNINSTWWK